MSEKEIICFPTCRYHKEKGNRVFRSQEEIDEAGKGWVDSPARFKGKTKKAEEAPLKVPVDNTKDESTENPLDETNRFPGEKEYTAEEIDELKKRAKELKIQGFGIMKPATLAERVAEAEKAIPAASE